MNGPLSPDRLARELRRRGLPAEYVERLIEEWQDHVDDLVVSQEGGHGMEAEKICLAHHRVGDEPTLVDTAVKEFRKRTFAGRHPVLTFLLAPIPLTVVAWILYFFTGYLVGCVAVFLGGDWFRIEGKPFAEWPAYVLWAQMAFVFAAPIVPPLLVTMLTCRWGSMSGRSWLWPATACLLFAFLAGLFHINVEYPYAPGTGKLMICLFFSKRPLNSQLLHCAIPLIIGAFLLFRHGHPRRRTPPAASLGDPTLARAA
ncbi:MAG: hypothetical protein U1D30_23235 [Planctomycetota bacterium]